MSGKQVAFTIAYENITNPPSPINETDYSQRKVSQNPREIVKRRYKDCHWKHINVIFVDRFLLKSGWKNTLKTIKLSQRWFPIIIITIHVCI